MKSILTSCSPQEIERILNGEQTVLIRKKAPKCDLPIEVWKDIPSYEGLYQASNLGRIKSVDKIVVGKNKRLLKEKILTQQVYQGYKYQSLSKNGIAKLWRAHRIIALTFIPNPKNLEQINHKNGNKFDNRIENLEWNSRSENQRHAYKTGLQKISDRQRLIASEFAKTKRKPVVQLDINYNKIAEFESVSKASEILGISTTCISRVCNKKRKTTNGFIFEYLTRPPQSYQFVEVVK